ncbi:MAG: transcriptional regulator [Pseudopedobacter saltans]|uniref:Transcriptional regulator n=1 Tax=Pseudopedobacter saltans TaxID=151895 RepID=A0A2W5EVZ3_9SPHI|nr:MAG: transcriptional regulator [Pseudopedobacter saltans]
MSLLNKKFEILLPYVNSVLALLSKKWILNIIISINDGNHHFLDIQRDLVGISSNTLTKNLKELEANMLIERKCRKGESSEYYATKYLKSLNFLLVELSSWGKNHEKKLSSLSDKV